MKNFKKLSAIILSTLLATMQISHATFENFNTGLGCGDGMTGAIINSHSGGLSSVTPGTNSVDLGFDSSTHVFWNTLNLNSNETINFNALNGANNLTILNTVQNNMSKIYGNINANSGIGKLIISNPNGVLFDGAKFTTAGDTTITTRDMSLVNVNNLTDGVWNGLSDANDLIQVQILNNSDFSVGGELKIFAPKIVAENSIINAGNTLKLITANGADYIASSLPGADKMVTKLSAVNINGDIIVTNDVGAFAITDGGTINGNLNVETGGYVRVNESTGGDYLNVNGDINITAHNQQLMLRHANISGNVNLQNDGGFVDIGNVHVTGNANLKTDGFEDINSKKHNHYIHVVGNTLVDGDMNIDSSQNIHIGNYTITKHSKPYSGNLLDGSLTVGGDLNAKTSAGHITTTINTTAKNINFEAGKGSDGNRAYGGNILSDGKAVLTADTYQFKSDGYIGGISGNGTNTTDDVVINLMENYTFIPDDANRVVGGKHEYLTVGGGTITKLETPKVSADGNDVLVYIKSLNDLTLNSANAGDINLVAPDKQITITGDVHAKNINIGNETGTLKLDFPNRDFTTNYTSIKDNAVVTIAPEQEITYELANKPDVGYNSPDFKASDGTTTTYLIGPSANDVVPVNPEPVNPTPVRPQIKFVDEGENTINLRPQVVPEDVTAAPVNTPIAYASALDEDDLEGPVRKNVDGSVTVVRAFPVIK